MASAERKKVVLLGATGSIGCSTLRVIRAHRDRLELVGVASRSNVESLAGICHEFAVPHAVVHEADALRGSAGQAFPGTTEVSTGADALSALATLPEADIVLVAVVGAVGLRPTLAAIKAGKDIALANKECLVLGGPFIIEAARRKGVRLLPTDSEHNAIFQCLDGRSMDSVARLILTASGGAFRDRPLADLAKVSPAEATAHPNWSMGPKITVDSATMANKGLELIEARWLFDVPAAQLDVVLHPQSIVHSMVQFVDGSMLAQLSPPSMTFAIQHCLLYPDRAAGVEAPTDFGAPLSLDFKPPEPERYPCLQLAREALKQGDCAPAVFNAANEIAVDRFLANQLRFLEIPKLIEHCLASNPVSKADSLETLLAVDKATRIVARNFSL